MILLVTTLVLWLSHDAVAQGDLARLAKFADRVQLDVSPGGKSNLISDSAARALAAWPAVVGLEVRPPLAPAEAQQLRKIPRLHAILLGTDEGKTLTLLGPALVMTSAAPVLGKELERPCGNVRVLQLEGGAMRFEVNGRVDDCVVAALETRAEVTVPLVANAQAVPAAQWAPAPLPVPRPEPLAAEPMGPTATVLVDVDGEEPDAGRYRALAKQRLVGRTISGVSLPFDGASPARVLTRAHLVPLAALGKEVAWPVCQAAAAQALWRLVLATDRPSKGKARLTVTLSSLRCSTWENFAESETDFKSVDAALGAAVGLSETLLARGQAGGAAGAAGAKEQGR